MGLGLASILLLAVVGSASANNFCQQVVEGNFVYNCCGTSKVPVACIDSNNNRLNCGSSVNIFRPGQPLGFTFSCIQPTDVTIEYRPTACVSADGQSAPIGGTLIHGNFHYLCTKDHNGQVSTQLNGCANNGQIVQVGTTSTYCGTTGCHQMKCISTGNNGVSLRQEGCRGFNGENFAIGATFIQNPGQTITFRYTCLQNGETAILKPTECVANGKVVSVGSSVVIGQFEYLCSMENDVIGLNPHKCLTSDGKVVASGSEVQVFPDGKLGYVYKCEVTGNSIVLRITGCAANGQSVYAGNSISVDGVSYSCTQNGNGISYVPQGCWNNNQVVQVGQNCQVCVSTQCSTMTCVQGVDNTPILKPAGCQAPDGQTVGVGATATVYSHQGSGYTCTCQHQGGVPKLVITGCVTSTGVVGIGNSAHIQGGNYVCNAEGVLKPQGCKAPDGQTVGVGATATVYSHQGSGYTCTCQEQGGAQKLIITGCVTSNGAVGIGQSANIQGGNYVCNAEGALKPQGCLNNNQVVPIGQNCNQCISSQNQCFSMQCVSGPQNQPILKPIGCIGVNNEQISIGSTSKVFHNANNQLGFTYICELNAAGQLVYRPNGCILRSGESASLGQTIDSGNFRYSCIGHPNHIVDFKIKECILNGQTIPIGTKQRVCNNGGQCQIAQCSQSGEGVNFSRIGCVFGTQEVVVGGQCIWQQQRCTCSDQPTCIPYF